MLFRVCAIVYVRKGLYGYTIIYCYTYLQPPSRLKQVLCRKKAHQRTLHIGISLFVSVKLFSIEHVLHSILPATLCDVVPGAMK